MTEWLPEGNLYFHEDFFLFFPPFQVQANLVDDYDSDDRLTTCGLKGVTTEFWSVLSWTLPGDSKVLLALQELPLLNKPQFPTSNEQLLHGENGTF